MGLEKDDTIVRRRMAQKMEFLLADLAPQAEPSDEKLQAFLEENTERFQEPTRYSFMHVFLSRDQRGEQVDEDARRALDELRHRGRNVDPVELSDPFMQGQQMVAYSEREVGRVLGLAYFRIFSTRSSCLDSRVRRLFDSAGRRVYLSVSPFLITTTEQKEQHHAAKSRKINFIYAGRLRWVALLLLTPHPSGTRRVPDRVKSACAESGLPLHWPKGKIGLCKKETPLL